MAHRTCIHIKNFMHSMNRYVLIADDDSDDIILMEEAFRRKKITEKLVSVRNGFALLNHLYSITDSAEWPKLILLDLNMPLKNGRDTLTEIKQDPLLKKIPVVIYSTTDNQQEIKRCYELGANSYVVKPSAFEQILSTVEAIHNYWCQTASVAF
jgi:CheY-like chemotaxis protein